MNKTLVIVDGNSLFFRAYYGTLHTKGGILKNSQEIPINAILTFSRMILNVINNFSPSHILVAFDTGKKTERHLIYQEYKSKRMKAPHELQQQFPIARELLDSMKIKHFAQEGFEADDIIGTLATKYQHNFSRIFIFSSDRDLLQLINLNISLVIPQNGSKNHKIINSLNFQDEIGILPFQVPDFKGIVGDSSDNLPGVKGIGLKTATTLLKQYGTLENVYKNINYLSEKMREKFLKSENIAFLSKKLATLNLEMTLPFDLNDIQFNPNYKENLISFFKKYELFSLIKQINKK